MAAKPDVKLVNGFDLPTSTGAAYTVPSSLNRVAVTQAIIVNHTAGAITVNLYVLMNGQSVANNYKVLDTHVVAANSEEVVTGLLGNVIDAGGSIQGDASSATSVSITVSGVQYTT
jgi:uncharacterized protein YacL